MASTSPGSGYFCTIRSATVWTSHGPGSVSHDTPATAASPASRSASRSNTLGAHSVPGIANTSGMGTSSVRDDSFVGDHRVEVAPLPA